VSRIYFEIFDVLFYPFILPLCKNIDLWQERLLLGSVAPITHVLEDSILAHFIHDSVEVFFLTDYLSSAHTSRGLFLCEFSTIMFRQNIQDVLAPRQVSERTTCASNLGGMAALQIKFQSTSISLHESPMPI
jgi:hypothetical protein